MLTRMTMPEHHEVDHAVTTQNPRWSRIRQIRESSFSGGERSLIFIPFNPDLKSTKINEKATRNEVLVPSYARVLDMRELFPKS